MQAQSTNNQTQQHEAATGGVSPDVNALIERMGVVYDASRVHQRSGVRLAERLAVVRAKAGLYFRFAIPLWPPQFLLRKLVRRAILPLLMPQVEFNEAVRDVLQELSENSERQSHTYRQALVTILELEDSVTDLKEQVKVLQLQLEIAKASDNLKDNGNGAVNGHASAFIPVTANEEKAF